jgi:hypothetical protein
MLPASTSSSRRNGYALVLYIHPPTTQQSRGHFHIPAHMLSMNPFTHPFTFGNNACITTDGSHVGMNGDEPVVGMLSGSTSKEFMVLAESTFVVLTPKKVSLSLHSVLFPSSKTHTVSFGKKGRSYPIRTGSVIMAQTDSVLRTVTIFLSEHEHYARANRALSASINHFGLAYFKLIQSPKLPKQHPFFDPTAPRLMLLEEWGRQDQTLHPYLHDVVVADCQAAVHSSAAAVHSSAAVLLQPAAVYSLAAVVHQPAAVLNHSTAVPHNPASNLPPVAIPAAGAPSAPLLPVDSDRKRKAEDCGEEQKQRRV